MEYGTIKRSVLELINQSTIAGESVALTYNNQADYVLRIPNLINQGIMKIRTTVFPDRRTTELTDGTRRGNEMLYPLPANCRSLVSGGVWKVSHHCAERTNEYSLLGKSILLPARPIRSPEPEYVIGGWTVEVHDGGYFIEYFAYPEQLPADPTDDYPLMETPEVIQAAEYYAAAMLVLMEDEFTYSTLMREFEERRTAMRPPLTAEVHPVHDAYGFGE